MKRKVDHCILLTNINKAATETRSEKIRFGAVGVINTLIDFSLLFTLKYFGFPIIAANTISTAIAFVASFTLNKKVVFRVHNSNIKQEIALFIIVTLFGLWVLQPLFLSLSGTYVT
jgi:putative flippase GtrA